MFELHDFGAKIFDIKVMRAKLPSPVFKKWEETLKNRNALDRPTADAIAHAMKEWAIEHGCTHYSHWFQPLHGATAEKHDAFIDIKDGNPIFKFSGKSLIKGEPDASSFPNGGLRATFEARGYTYWDCTSPAFIRGNLLCIPTVFVGFNGETLDTKAPLLKSMALISKEATRIVNAFGDKDVSSVSPCIGLEQEYFLIDQKDFEKRDDLFLTGKTLYGALPCKAQELGTHYLGTIPNRVQKFMNDVNTALWEVGVYAKLEHNEAAPSQFEIVPIFASANIAVDQNHVIMEMLQKKALDHGLVCLLHEKPFKGVNGSGKHNNWSLFTDTGVNLLDPGKDPHENVQFLTFICAVIRAVDKYQALIRMSSSNSGNDFRLGAHEAPPAVVSIFLGQHIESILEQLVDEKPKTYEKNSLNEFGITSLSYLPHDNSDRNRTSPIAFTGNKFEFRMLGSSMNPAHLNIIINTIVADSLKDIADKLENQKYRQNKRKAALDICAAIMKEHRRILYSGDGYSKKWVDEAKKRGLCNYQTYVESIIACESKENSDVFTKYRIYSPNELKAHRIVSYTSYYNARLIEAKTMISMFRKTILPAVRNELIAIHKMGDFIPSYYQTLAHTFKDFINNASVQADMIENKLDEAASIENKKDASLYILKEIIPHMEKMRNLYDDIECHLSDASLSYPTYKDLFFRLDY